MKQLKQKLVRQCELLIKSMDWSNATQKQAAYEAYKMI